MSQFLSVKVLNTISQLWSSTWSQLGDDYDVIIITMILLTLYIY